MGGRCRAPTSTAPPPIPELEAGSWVPGRPLPWRTLPGGRTYLAVPPGEAVGAAAVVLAVRLLARAPIPAGPRAAQAWPGCEGGQRGQSEAGERGSASWPGSAHDGPLVPSQAWGPACCCAASHRPSARWRGGGLTAWRPHPASGALCPPTCQSWPQALGAGGPFLVESWPHSIAHAAPRSAWLGTDVDDVDDVDDLCSLHCAGSYRGACALVSTHFKV